MCVHSTLCYRDADYREGLYGKVGTTFLTEELYTHTYIFIPRREKSYFQDDLLLPTLC